MRALSVLAPAVLLAWIGSAWAADTTTDSVSGELELMGKLTPKERSDYADNAIVQMNKAVGSVQKMLDQAKKAGDAQEVQCLNSRLTALDALLQIAQGAEQNMRDAAAQQDNAVSDREFRKIVVGLDNANRLEADAQACLTPGINSGTTSSTLVSGEAGVGTDTEPTNFDSLAIGFDPPQASPFE